MCSALSSIASHTRQSASSGSAALAFAPTSHDRGNDPDTGPTIDGAALGAPTRHRRALLSTVTRGGPIASGGSAEAVRFGASVATRGIHTRLGKCLEMSLDDGRDPAIGGFDETIGELSPPESGWRTWPVLPV